MRECGNCHKCCDGWLKGNVNGKSFYPGKPCHFVLSRKGCTIYENRPDNPCKSYVCEWLVNDDFPEWFKPELSNVLINKRNVSGHNFYCLKECGIKIDSAALNWFIQYALTNNYNIVYEVDGGKNFIGCPEFVEAYRKTLPE